MLQRLAELERKSAGLDQASHDLASEIQRIRQTLGTEAAPVPAGLTGRARASNASSRALVFIIVLFVFVVGAGVAGFVLLRGTVGEKFGGHVSVSGSVFGSFEFDVTDCDSGASYVPQFFGADVKSETQKLRIYGSGDDAYLALWQPQGKQTMEVSRQSCSRWDVLVDWAHVRVNRVDTVSGHLHVDCALPQGGKLVADAEFSRCAF